MNKCAIFDFDGTLTIRDTVVTLVFILLSFRPLNILKIIALTPGFIQNRRRIDNQVRKNELLGKLLAGLDLEIAEQIAQAYAKKTAKVMRTNVLNRLNECIQEKIKVVVITASPEFAVNAVFQDKDVYVIGTKFELENNRFTGKILGENCFGNEKLNRLIEWQRSFQINPDYIEAWSDSLSDLPIMNLAEKQNWIKS